VNVTEEDAMHTHQTEHKTFARPDETREFPHGHAEILKVGGGEVGRLVFDAWVVGDEPVVVVDWFGASSYAKA
jgi:hypothetical protein